MYSAVADKGDLFQRGFVAALGKRVPDRALTPFRDVEHLGGKRQAVGILEAAHILADQARIAGVHDTESALGVVNEKVVGMAFEPH
jgi:hypothetical protein